jgi:hypothetical protein
MEKLFFSLALCCHNLKVELLNGEQKKITFYAMKTFLALTLCFQPESRTSQWRTKNYVLCDGKVFYVLGTLVPTRK